ncbi:DUF4268 domain-containing protein [Mucisphaera sp.]|uniref:DUF4268 domain-containing protein n=1 Tax=Mucisphaera sp. TaxID=2913024 RepID=UPI003D1297C5
MKQDYRLGTIRKRSDLRSIWPNEASSFTPWLSQRLEQLSEALGLDLELEGTEQPVGNFSVDILARDLSRNRTVVIENQLEASDHIHLGQLLTYASGLDAETVIWIVKQLRPEHRQALDWLNQHTDDDLEFFAVSIELLQIDDSLLAPHFKLEVTPNEWRKSAIRSKSSASSSDKSESYRLFFQELIDVLREQHKFTNARRGQAQNFYNFASGFSGINYSASFNRGGMVRAELYISTPSADKNTDIFESLMLDEDAINEEFGSNLTWDAIDGRKACRVYISHTGDIDVEDEKRQSLIDFFVENLMRLKLVFEHRLQNVV